MDLVLINSALAVLYCLWWLKILRTTRYNSVDGSIESKSSVLNPNIKTDSSTFESLKPTEINASRKTQFSFTGCSIVVPFRNEEHRILPLLDSIMSIHTEIPWEVIFMDDHSTDKTTFLISNWMEQNKGISSKLLQSPNLGKKEAILSAVNIASYPWILTTDADCVLPSTIINSHCEIAQSNPQCECILGRVEFIPNHQATAFQTTYEILENQVLVAIGLSAVKTSHPFALSDSSRFLGIGILNLGKKPKTNSPVAANGANLCFYKSSWIELGGIQEHRSIASGDDIFTAAMFYNRNPESLAVNNQIEGVIKAQLCPNPTQLIQQRLRWFKKSFLQKSQKTLFQQVFFGTYLITLWGLTMYAVYRGYVLFIFVPISTKAVLDGFLGHALLRYHRYQQPRLFIPASSLLQSLALPILALAAPFISFNWKDRKLLH